MANNNSPNRKPRVLILGGVGFIGRNLVDYLVSGEYADKIRIADKVIPQMAWLSDCHKQAFSQVEFKHANLINPKSVAGVFNNDDDIPFDYVVNLAAETKYGQSESVYKDGIYKLSLNCANEAAKRKVSCYIEVTSSQMTSSDKRAITPESSCEPWTLQAKEKLAVEQAIPDIDGLNYIILRPAIVYGPGDRNGLTPRLIVGGVYKFIQEKMKMLWSPELKMNTVHVRDVCSAIWHLCRNGKPGSTYCLSDKTNADQGKIGAVISEIFNINHDYVGTLMSNIAKMSISDIVDEINDKHMAPWGEACQRDGIQNTPLNPYLDEELLCENPVHIDGTGIEKSGFHYDYPQMTVQLVKEVLDDFAKAGLFPPSLVSAS